MPESHPHVTDFEALRTFTEQGFIKLPFETFTQDANRAISQWRKNFYTQIATTLPDKPAVYYPGSGADPIPLTAFPDAVYGSLADPDRPYFD